jgi:hypothetical protein
VTTEFIMVPVPRERVQEVYRLLASEPTQAAAALTEGVRNDAVVPWSDSEIARAYRESPERMRRFLDCLATVAGQPVTSEESAKAVGYSRHQQAGMLGAFGHRVKGRYGRSTWFFEYAWSDQRGAWTYSMGEAAAKVLRALKG